MDFRTNSSSKNKSAYKKYLIIFLSMAFIAVPILMTSIFLNSERFFGIGVVVFVFLWFLALMNWVVSLATTQKQKKT